MVLDCLITSPYAYVLNRMCSTEKKSVYSYLSHNIYEVDSEELNILLGSQKAGEIKRLSRTPSFSRSVERLKKDGLLVDHHTIWKHHHARYLYIETHTDCNWRCEYCPVQYSKLQKNIMEMDLFDNILSKAKDYGKIEIVGLNFYNEPTLDPYFDDRLERIHKMSFQLNLYTNGSGLNMKKLRRLKDMGNLHNIYFNLPSLDETEFRSMTGSNCYAHTISIIDSAIKIGLNVVLSIQGEGISWKNNINRIRSKYGDRVNEPLSIFSTWKTDDRAGNLQNKYNRHIQITDEYLLGCRDLINALYVDVNGNVLLCYNDFHKEYIIGNIRQLSISELLSNTRAQELRRMIFGGAEANDDLICRKCSLCEEQFTLSALIEKINTTFRE